MNQASSLPPALVNHIRDRLGREINGALAAGHRMYWVKGPYHREDVLLRAVTGQFKDGRQRSKALRDCYDSATAINLHLSIIACGGDVDLDSLTEVVAGIDAAKPTTRIWQ